MVVLVIRTDRALSLREGEMLQTFPKDYLFTEPDLGGNYPIAQVALQIGNAVPPKLGEVIRTPLF